MLAKSLKQEIPFDCLNNWQKTVNTLTKLFDVPVVLIMRLCEDELEVLVASESGYNPFTQNERFVLGAVRVFEKNILQAGALLAPETKKDEILINNQELLKNMESYAGIPLYWRNDDVFGLICILDKKNRDFSTIEIDILKEIKGIIERDFKILRQNEIINKELGKKKKIDRELRYVNEALKAEPEKKHIEDDYRLIVENQNGLIVKFDKDYKLNYISPQYALEFGSNSEELLGKSFFPFIHKDDKEHVKKSLKDLKREPYECSHEERMKTIRGWRWFLWNNKSLLDKSGNIEEIVAVGHDITTRKEFEFALKESKERYSLVTKGVNDGLWDRNFETGKIYFSRKWKSMLGYAEDELENIYETWENLIHPDDLRSTLKANFDYLNGNVSKYEVEYRMRHKNGHWVNILSRGFKVMDTDGTRVIRLVGTHLNITDLRKAENALKKSESQFRKIIEMNLIPMVVTDPNQDIIMFNRAFTKIFGYTIEDVPSIEVWWEKAYPDYEYRELVKNEWNTAVEEAVRTVSEIEKQIWKPTCKNGTEKIVEFSFVSLGELNIVTMIDITELKTTEKALKESEEKSRALSEATDEALFFSDKGFCIECNRAACEMFGYEHDELIGIFGTDVIADESKDLVKKYMMSGYEEPYEAIALMKDGTEFWAEFHGKMYSYKGKKVRVTSVRNISKRKKTEEALVFSEEKFRAAFKTSPDSVNINRMSDGHYIEINEGFTQLTGYDEEDVRDKSSVDINIWADSKDRHKLVNELKQNGYCTNLKGKFRTKDGKIITGLMSATVITLQNEQYVISITKNIQNLKEAEEELIKAKVLSERREKEFRDLFNEMLDGFAIHEMIYNEGGNPVDYRFIDINPAYERLTGLKREHVINKTVLEIKPGIEKYWIDNYGRVAKTGEPYWFEDYAKELNRYYSGMAYCTQPGHFAVILSDVTDKKKAEQRLLENDRRLKVQNEDYLVLNEELTSLNLELMEAKEKAIESDKLKTAFLANMSHEIRTPMNGIMGFSGLLAKSSLTEEKRIKYIDIIQQNSNQLLSIINDLVDISKIEAGQIEIGHDDVRIDFLTRSLADLYYQKALDRQIDFKLVNKNIDIEIITDETKLRQILINLLDNAFKFTASGEISFGYEVKDEFVEFFVFDTGIGIAEDAQEIIFERFRQVEISSARKYGGTGLGLSISKAYVKKMGGKIWVKSFVNKGTRFYFTLPLKLTQIDKNFTPDNMTQTKLHNWSDKTILIAEDEQINFNFFKEVLEETNVNLIWATNGQEAIKLCLENNAIDLVLMDIKMPVMNGYDATIAIKKTYPDLPIIAQTAYALIGDESKAKKAGCDDYIYKPINVDNLIAKLSKFLK